MVATQQMDFYESIDAKLITLGCPKDTEGLFKMISQFSVREYFDFIPENMHVYQKFEDACFLLRGKGKKKAGSNQIVEYLRWDIFMRTTDDDFKLKATHSPCLARHLIIRHPSFRHFFNLKDMRKELNEYGKSI